SAVFPQLLENRSPGTPLRVWVPRCSTGEEVYSLAISLQEFLDERGDTNSIKLFGTDISENGLAAARAGVYGENIAAEVSPQRLSLFFTKRVKIFEVNEKLRDLCVFAPKTVTGDPPFSQLDLVSCRNLLIDVDSVLQNRVLPVLHFALKPTGFLMLGPLETVGALTELFDPVDKKHKIYRRSAGPSRLRLEFPLDRQARTMAATSGFADMAPRDPHQILREADRVVLARYAPAGVVVDEQLQVIQFRGHTGECLEMAPGTPTVDFLQMAREGL